MRRWSSPAASAGRDARRARLVAGALALVALAGGWAAAGRAALPEPAARSPPRS